MSPATVGSTYATDRDYFLFVLQSQIAKLRVNPSGRSRVLQGLRELSQLMSQYIEASYSVSDTPFYDSCWTFQPVLDSAIATLSEDSDPFTGDMVAEQLEKAFSWENPTSW
ncbi:uncharacterized protein N7479_008328 [Penicillium vulpinum]|uniref:Uncharacterized protein n=1 Tax=Penicillium vulpinum TaxID=29845 RepID=A0A1V6RAE7_9EURO|nr:uncharacterized protein N7479_008328 [Penicillium vulpinum]KAJ5961178.1 hypothetical protein N7479_008328 [Penicillium vulpinum]OQD98206.1 hypothetical protein PENVUL_c075G06834 [Penicillium vulpinum]